MSDEAFPWASWRPLGFPPAGVAANDRMAVASNADGHLELFVVGADGALWHTWQTSPNGSWVGRWSSRGRPADGVSLAISSAEAIRVGQNSDGRLEVFVTGDDQQVWHIWQVVPSGNWSPVWDNLGTPDPGIRDFRTAVFTDDQGQLEVFVLNEVSGQVWERWQVAPNSSWNDSWFSLDRPGEPLGLLGPFVAVLDGNAEHELIAIPGTIPGSPLQVWHNSRTRGDQSGVPRSWDGWRVLSDGPPGVDPLAEFNIEAVGYNQDGRLELVCSSQGDFWHTFQSSAEPNGWSGSWFNFGHPPAGTLGVFAMGQDALSRLETFAMDLNMATWRQRQDQPNSGWTSWDAISFDPSVGLNGGFVLGRNQDKRFELFCRGAGDTIWHIWQLK